MTKYNVESEDHIKILKALDCSHAVASLQTEIALMKQRMEETKYDKEKADSRAMWFAGMAFSIIMAVSASLINSNAQSSVLQEKVTEQKSEIELLRKNQDNIVTQFNDLFQNHEH